MARRDRASVENVSGTARVVYVGVWVAAKFCKLLCLKLFIIKWENFKFLKRYKHGKNVYGSVSVLFGRRGTLFLSNYLATRRI